MKKMQFKFGYSPSVPDSGPTGPTGPAGPFGSINTFTCANNGTVSLNNTSTLITADSYGQYATVGTQLYINGSGYLKVTGFVILGGAYYLTVENSLNAENVVFSVGDIVTIVGIQSNEHVEVVERGNPGQGSPLELSSFDIVHHYSTNTTENYIDISTTMVEGGVYELNYSVSNGTTTNNDLRLYPDYGSFGVNTFYNVYQNSDGTPDLLYTTGNANSFYADHVVGASYGWDPVGKLTIYNQTTEKKVRYESGDTTAVVQGSGYWTNGSGFSNTSITALPYDTTTVWANVGRLTFGGPSFASWNIWVKRIA